MNSDRFTSAVHARDHAALTEALAPGVSFRSPVVYKPYEGREVVSALLGAVFQVFTEFEYTDRLEDGDTAALIFRANVGDREVQGLDLLRFGEDGLVSELTVMVRPMSGVHALAEAMGRELERAGVAAPASG